MSPSEPHFPTGLCGICGREPSAQRCGRCGNPATVRAISQRQKHVAALVAATADAKRVGKIVKLLLNPVTGAARIVGLASRSLTLLDGLLSQTPRLLADMTRLLSESSELTRRVDRLLTAVEATRAHADQVIGACDQTRSRADDLIDNAGVLVGRVTPLVGEVEPPVRAVLPLLDAAGRLDPRLVTQLARLAELADLADVISRMRPLLEAAADLDPELVRVANNLTPLLDSLGAVDDDIAARFAGAYAEVLHRLPTLLAQMTDDVVPSLETLATAVPDVQQLREIATRLEPLLLDVELVLAGAEGTVRLTVFPA